MKKHTEEMLKEGGRIVFFAAAGACINYILTFVVPTLTVSPEIVSILTFVLRLADKWIHENKAIPSSGLSPI